MFHLQTPFSPAGDQPRAIAGILDALRSGEKHHVLLGVTGSGKTFTMAQVIQQLCVPTLVIAPNKTLAAQLFLEFKGFFPEDQVGFFISYYDYFQPEAYIPSTDTYIAKDSSINDDIDKMRHAATRSLFEHRNTIIVASVSCIYGLGSPSAYSSQATSVARGQELRRDDFLRALIAIQYRRSDTQLQRGCFRVRGDNVDILPAHQKDEALRVTFFGDQVESLSRIDALTGKKISRLEKAVIYPGSHYVTEEKSIRRIVTAILSDLGVALRHLNAQGKYSEAQRLEQRTMADIEAFEQLGFCPGIENYSRYLSAAKPGEAPACLLDYFPKDFLTIVDESHITIPQLRGMYRGDQMRKQTLVDYGFRLPSALDNRPLNFTEFLERSTRLLYVSATPGPFELEQTKGCYSEQIIRPTGIIDPPITVEPATHQVDHLLGAMRQVITNKGRVLITTLTKRMAEDLSQYYESLGLRIRYLHADVDSLARADLLRDLRLGVYDVLIGINLLREGLDLPEVQLVAVMDADKEGFLRSRTSLIQIVGRAARNDKARVIFYADKITDSMTAAMAETERRRELQLAYNQKHNITPHTVIKAVPDELRSIYGLIAPEAKPSLPEQRSLAEALQHWGVKNTAELEKKIVKLTGQMHTAAGRLDFEKAAQLRDEVTAMRAVLLLNESL